MKTQSSVQALERKVVPMKTRVSRRSLLLLVWCAIGVWAAPIFAEVTSLPENFQVANLQTQLSQLQEASHLDETQKQHLAEIYQKAITHARAAEQWLSAQQEYHQMIHATTPPVAASPSVPIILEITPQLTQNWTITEMEHLLAQSESELTALRMRLGELDTQTGKRTQRRIELPVLQSNVQERLAQIPAAPPIAVEDEAPELTTARSMLKQIQRVALEAELEAYQKEVLSFDWQTNLIQRERNHLQQLLPKMEQQTAELRALIDTHRRQAAQADAQHARAAIQELSDKDYPVLYQLAQENHQLTQERAGEDGIVARISAVTEQLTKLRETIAMHQQDINGLRTRLQTSGLTYGLGQLMRKYQSSLPDMRQLRQDIKQQQIELSRVQHRIFELEQKIATLPANDQRLRQQIIYLQSENQQRFVTARQRMDKLLDTRRRYLSALLQDYNDYFLKTADLMGQAQQLLNLLQANRKFVREHVLWIRSAEPVKWMDLRVSISALGWFLSPQRWRELLRVVFREAYSNPVLYVLALLVIPGLWYRRTKMCASITAWNNMPIRMNGLSPAVRKATTTIAMTFACALTWPLPAAFMAWQLSTSIYSTEFAHAVADGLMAMIFIWLTFQLLLDLAQPTGLLHSDWNIPSEFLDEFRKYLQRLSFLIPCLVFIVKVIHSQEIQEYADSLGRLLHILTWVILTRTTYQLAGRWVEIQARSNEIEIPRLHQSYWFWPLVCIPLSITVLDWFGYTHSALEISRCIINSIWVLVMLALIHSIVNGWLIYAHQALTLQFLARRAHHAAKQLPDTPQSQHSTPHPDPTEITAQINVIGNALLGLVLFLALWRIWSDLLPALEYFSRVQIWPTPLLIDARTITDLTGVITLKNVLQALITITLTIICVRNLPGLLEIIVLQHLEMDSGARYAANMLARYGLMMVGLLVVAEIVGIRWEHIHWLVAAFTVGLGFGLQEICANFASGLILLFERPIRVGDTVSIGAISGTVTRIQMRATTIMDWDRKDLIVPNREFITGQVVNWTHSDQILRVLLSVGVAYGSDVSRIHEVLQEVAIESPLVLDTPAPRVIFESFGDSALEFSLRVYVSHINNLLQARDELNTAIDAAFRRENIEIPFPQRDLHVRSISASLPVDTSPK